MSLCLCAVVLTEPLPFSPVDDQVTKLTYVSGDKQRGCSAGWNEVAQRRPEGAEYVIIANADAAFRPNAIAHVRLVSVSYGVALTRTQP